VRPTILLRICVVLCVLTCFPAPPAAASPLRGRLHAALAGFHGPGTGAIAVDLETGRAVYAHNADRPLSPASNEKLALTYAALVVLGPAFRMRTELLGEGRLVDGTVWDGDLVVRGYGDPTLDRAGLLELARRLRESGVRRVTGSLIADESFFDSRRSGPGWKGYFVPGESSPLSALSVEGRSALETARLLRGSFRAVGIRVHGRTRAARAAGWPLAVRFSPPLPEILRQMDVQSDNHTAELLLKQLGAVAGRGGSTAAGAAVVRSVLVEHGVPLAGVRIADGSGLSSLDRLTAKTLVTILQRAWADREIGPALLDALPVAGRDGTLRHRLRDTRARGNVRAKTGTLANASALSGFVRRRYVFAILQNGPSLSAWAARGAQDRFVTVLAAQ
jgi:D-alanyl-D-alanine carboxypeptidase/D-alanyl-D-alanine-endopeptidase (penicillin-binding protein 4)